MQSERGAVERGGPGGGREGGGGERGRGLRTCSQVNIPVSTLNLEEKLEGHQPIMEGVSLSVYACNYIFSPIIHPIGFACDRCLAEDARMCGVECDVVWMIPEKASSNRPILTRQRRKGTAVAGVLPRTPGSTVLSLSCLDQRFSRKWRSHSHT